MTQFEWRVDGGPPLDVYLQAHNLKTTSYQRRYDVTCIVVDTTLFWGGRGGVDGERNFISVQTSEGLNCGRKYCLGCSFKNLANTCSWTDTCRKPERHVFSRWCPNNLALLLNSFPKMKYKRFYAATCWRAKHESTRTKTNQFKSNCQMKKF